jgi:hypothetical protein
MGLYQAEVLEWKEKIMYSELGKLQGGSCHGQLQAPALSTVSHGI